MKPLNLDNSPCSPTSSNCVIWQGPDLTCIKLCKGDTVSEVIAKLATELCVIMDQLNITNYDLSCFDLTACPPTNFQALIQFLINHICALEKVIIPSTVSTVPTVPAVTTTTTTDFTTGGRSPVSSTCPDCVVTVASCFIVGTQTTMQLVDYVTLIAEKVCAIIDDIVDLQNQITNVSLRVTVLENTPAVSYTLPSILVDCTLQNSPLIGSGGGATQIDLVLNALINDPVYGYCALTTVLGTTPSLNTAIGSACILSTSTSLVYGTPMSVAYSTNWVSTPLTLADSFTNAWISICDIFNYTASLVAVTVVDAGANITVTPVTVGTTTTYTVASTGLSSFAASMTINSSYQPLDGSILLKDPALVTGLLDGQVIHQYNSIASDNVVVTATATPGSYVANASVPACSFGTFDNATTGSFTVTIDGMYLIEGCANLKAIGDYSAYWQSGVLGTAAGSFGVGLYTLSNNLLSGQFHTILPEVNKTFNASTSVLAYLIKDTVIHLGLLNLTDRNYNGNSYGGEFADSIQFSITKIK